MKVVVLTVALLATTWLPIVISQQHALFVKRDAIESGKRVTRQTSADQMVQNILQWLQGVYTQNSRRIRQGSFREYLPPTNTQKPRPFEPSPEGQGSDNTNFVGYPPSGISPQPSFPEPTTGNNGGYPTPGNEIFPPIEHPNFNGYVYPNNPQPGFPSPSQPGYVPKPFPTKPPPGYSPPTTGQPTTGYPTGRPTTEQPVITTGYPEQPSTGYPGPSTGYPGPSTGYPGPSTGYPTPSTGYPGPSTEYPVTGYPTTVHPIVSESTTVEITSPPQTFPTRPPPQPFPTRPPPSPYPTQPPTETRPTYPTQPPTEAPTYVPTHQSTYPTLPTETEAPIHPPGEIIQTEPPAEHTSAPLVPQTDAPAPEEETDESSQEENKIEAGDGDESTGVVAEDLKHPPHIHEIEVECAKDMMTINIEFNRKFDGIIYSKGFYSNPDCRYVQENSGKTKFSFTVSLNSCGTEFVNAFDTQGQSYLENVLVLQNEAGIQEVWDTIRAVRCLWEGNLNKALSVALSVGMLTQEIVTFSGDTAMARLDIQLGRGPFAPPANGLVKIGDTMTLVVSVTGDPGFDIQVKDCRAKDSTGENVVALTDDNGCVLKPKLFGAFQKTRNTQNTGASIIAYAFFNAFKFPDVMDLMIECNVELCKTDCEVCSEPGQKYEPGRRRKREVYNDTLGEPVTMGKSFRVILPEDLSNGEAIINLRQREEVCLSTQSFVFSSALLISLLSTSTLFSAYLWLKNQRLMLQKY